MATRAKSRTLSRKLKGAVGGAAYAVKGAARVGIGAARGASGKVAAALPSRKTVRVAVGKALIAGGRALIDPRAAVGEIAVRIGEGLLADADQLRWFVVRIDDQGDAKTFAFVHRSAAQTFYNRTSRTFPRQFLCECVAGPSG